MGKPPALPGDCQILTFAGVHESLLCVNRSKLTKKEALDVPGGEDWTLVKCLHLVVGARRGVSQDVKEMI